MKLMTHDNVPNEYSEKYPWDERAAYANGYNTCLKDVNDFIGLDLKKVIGWKINHYVYVKNNDDLFITGLWHEVTKEFHDAVMRQQPEHMPKTKICYEPIFME